MEFGQVHHIEYYVNDLEKAKGFWTWFLKELNYKVSAEFGDGISYEHPNGTYIVFVQVQDKHLSIQNNRQGNGLNHIAFMGKSEEDLDSLQQSLEAKSIKILKRKKGYLCFEDPCDFAVEVYSNT